MSWSGLDPAIMGPALAAGLLVVATHVPLGHEVLKRGIIFIDLAVAQVAGVGVILAHTLGLGHQGWVVQVSAVGAALLAAGILHWTERRWPEVQEALIGALFVLAASAGILLLANDPRAGEHLKDILVGQILWVEPAVLGPVAALYAGVLAVWLGLGERRGPLAFYGLFAIAVTASVQLVGVYLVFATLILPALATRGIAERARVVASYSVGAGGYVLGLAASALLDLPSGPVVVWSLAVLGVATAALGARVAGGSRLAAGSGSAPAAGR